MVRHPAQSATQAWKELQAVGGMELNGRDSDLAECLRQELNPDAQTFDDALRVCSTDDLVRALFNVASPYVQMFSAILRFFKRAKATQGRSQWSVVVSEEHLELRHFEELLTTWEEVKCEFDVPAIDWRGAWALLHATKKAPVGDLGPFEGSDAWIAELGIDGLGAWFSEINAGTYTSLPRELSPSAVPSQLKDASSILEASIQIIRSTWPDRAAMDEAIESRDFRHDETNGLNAWTIAKNERDHCIRTGVKVLARALRSKSNAFDAFALQLSEELDPFERTKIGVHASVEDLKRILSLPVWKRRHELYAVWIATEIVHALSNHDCELHHSNGQITFSFGGAVVATIHSTCPEIRLYTERRSPLQGAIGEGRKSGAQPDYSLWRGTAPSETCGLVVEVKHYKKDAPARFRAVLVDYAKAHPYATIVLVGHGPIRDYADDSDSRINTRCMTIGDLTVSHTARRNEFAGVVRAYVGNPVVSATNAPQGLDALIVDVSASMALALRSAEMAAFLNGFASTTEVVLVDTNIRERCSIEETTVRLASIDFGGGTSLIGPLQELLTRHPKLLVLTDIDGWNELAQFGFHIQREFKLGAVDVILLCNTQGAPA